MTTYFPSWVVWHIACVKQAIKQNTANIENEDKKYMSAYTREELEPEMPSDEFEIGAEREADGFNEMEEMELAAELLEVTDESELDQFLGKLVRKAATAAGGSLNSSTGRALGGLLKGTIKKAFSTLGRAAGDYYALGLGIGSGVASNAGRILGLELEGLSGEDQEFEVAKRMVQLAGAAAGNAATAPQSLPSAVAAKRAVRQAARTHAPGMLKPIPKRKQSGCACHPAAGRWERRGPEIILDGL